MTLDYFYGQAGELFSFFRIPKALFQEQRFQDLSTDAKTLYGILLDRMSLSVKNEYSCCVRHEENRSENCRIVFPQMGVSRMGYGYCNIIYGQIRQKSLIFFVYL